MSNQEIAKLFRQVATAYTIEDEKKYRFQIIAYQRAADTIESAVTEISDLFKEGKLDELAGVGPSIQQHLTELCKTGHVAHFDSVLKQIPQSVFPLMEVASFGPKKAYKLVTHFHLNDPKTVIADVKKLAEKGEIAKLEGFGDKSQSEMLKGINEYLQGHVATERMPLPFANELAEQVIEYMKKCPEVKEIYPLGSLRRKVSTVGDIDLGVSTNEAQIVLDHFEKFPYASRVLDSGKSIASLLATNGKRIDIKTQSPQAFGALLQHFTGSKEHNVHLREIALKKVLSLSEYGIKNLKSEKMKEYKTEEEFYSALDMQWIPPEMRENTGEIELAQKKQIPKLLELKDIQGDLHTHSSFPIEPSHDLGINTFEEMLNKAKSLGYSYLAFSEHNPSTSKHTNDQVYNLIKKRNNELDKIYSNIKSVRIIKMLETDILSTGALGIDNNSLDLLDATIVSIHSVFNMDKESMTERILKGLSHPKAKILAHPTGRLINNRKGYDVNWDKLFEFCAKYDKALEINASPFRLDLLDSLVRQALKYKIKFSLGTDSHGLEQMDFMQYGVSVARRGWLTKDNVLNCMEYDKILTWLRR
ncbi:MAG TPA: PHP domain-containing protein [Patescibacteria group bacterium]|nr:PHP domain-containing protein [Patescibacteria group bacterium]